MSWYNGFEATNALPQIIFMPTEIAGKIGASTFPSRSSSESLSKPPRLRLDFLDGIRGLMALWVALGHGFQDYVHVAGVAMGNRNYLQQPIFQQAFYAHFAVDTFIVLSGFCLMLPVIRSGTLTLSGGWKTFFQRRARRILPPYYAALAIAIGLSVLRWWIGHPSGEATAIRQVDLTRGAILSHLFLVQNLNSLWERGIDGPLWSVATEWQIYFLFPLLLILRRRLPVAPFVALALAAGYALYRFTPYGGTINSWYLGLFALGMVAAEKALLSPVRTGERSPSPWIAAMPIGLFGLVCLFMATGFWKPEAMWWFDALWGLMIASMLWLCVRSAHLAPAARRILEWPPLVALGVFSYSFYLIHAPLMNVVVTLLLPRRWPPIIDAGIFLAAFPIVVWLSYRFHRRFERPFMNLPPR